MFLMLVVTVLLFQTNNYWHDQEDKIAPAMSR